MGTSNQQMKDLKNLPVATQKTLSLPNEQKVVIYQEFYFIQISLIKRNHFPDIRVGF